MNSFYKLFLLTLAIVCTAISFTKADTIINWFVFTEQKDTIEILPLELPKTWAEEWNGDCKSYHPSSYWKEWACYTPKGVWYFKEEIKTTSSTSLTCSMTTNGSIDNLIDRLKELKLQYMNNDYLCKDILSIEKELHALVDSIWLSRDKTITNTTKKETPKRLEFPAPTVKYITKTVSVKVCNMGVYDKVLDTCILMVTWAR